jgi:hypothetical protein
MRTARRACCLLAAALTTAATSCLASGAPSPIAVNFTAPVAGAYIEDVVPITLRDSLYPDLIILWTVGNGTRAVPIQILSYNRNRKAYFDNTTGVIRGSIPRILNPRNFIVEKLNSSGYPSVMIASQGLDQSPWPGMTNTLLLSGLGGRLVDASAKLPQRPAYAHDVSSGVVTKDGQIGIFVNNIYSKPNTPPDFIVTKHGVNFTNFTDRLPPALHSTYPTYTSSALVAVNKDSLADLIIGPEDQTVGPPELFLNPGNGDFSKVKPVRLPGSPLPATKGLYSDTPTGPIALDIRPIHISSRNYNDLLVVSTNGNYEGYAIQILINNGTGHFRDETKTRLAGAPSERTNSAGGVVVIGSSAHGCLMLEALHRSQLRALERRPRRFS